MILKRYYSHTIMTHTIMTVYGTRPEAIKVAPVIKALESSSHFESIAVSTGQHREMLDQVNDLFGIVPHTDLNIFTHGQSPSSIMANILTKLEPLLDETQPDAVLVQGDTSTSTAAALAAFYRKIPVIPLEAGLRSGNINSPFPEEANRKITTQIAKLHLAPTSESRNNLAIENIQPESISITVNTVIDALLTVVERKEVFDDAELEELRQSQRPILLVTTHRRENWGATMEGMGRALRRLAEENPGYTIVLPIHRNPLVREALLPNLEGLPNVVTTEPLEYGQFAHLLSLSRIILTDSGGVQEEEPSLGKPVLVMRENTERPEAVRAGTVKLIGTEEQRIIDEVSQLINDEQLYEAMAAAVNPYGDGMASERTLAAIAQMLNIGERLPDFVAA